MAAACPAQELTHEQAKQALQRSVRFFRDHCSAGGGYVYRVSQDFKKWEGEEKVTPTRAWIQPPATPAVGLAYLEAWQLTGDPLLKEAAIATADALLKGQLVSGGWGEFIEYDPELRKAFAYRIDFEGRTVGRKVRNITTFDDDKSQSVTRFLMRLDQALEFRNKRIHEAIEYALSSYLKAQYPNGAWGQIYQTPPDPATTPVLKAKFPKEWSRTYAKTDYWYFYTLNDNTQRDLQEMFFEASDIYGKPEYRAAAIRNADFLLLAQLPEPQPGWAQQYNFDMEPAWARKFEPPAITGSESQGIIEMLMVAYRRTGDAKYLKPIPRALDYYESLVLPDGQLARFYEIGTDKPLYFTKQYLLTYDDGDLPTHYGFKGGSKLARLRQMYDEVSKLPPDKLWTPKPPVRAPRLTDNVRRDAQRAVDTLNAQGAWVEDGWMDSRTFIKNVNMLARFVAASKP